MPALLTVALCATLSISSPPATSQDTAGTASFRLVNASNLDELQRELDEASADGYLVALAWPAYELAILRRRAASESLRSYRVFNGEKAINEGLSQGYRAVPDTLDVIGGALLVVAVKSSDDERYESLLLHTNRTSTLETEVQSARANDFRVVGMASDDHGHAALLERPAGQPSTKSSAAAALIATSAQETLQKELAARAAAGYSIVQASSWKETVLALERTDDRVTREYRVLSTTKSGTLEREMNGAAKQGFRLTPGTLHAQQKGAVPLFGRTGTEYVAIMERTPDGGPASEYLIVGARRIKTLVREFDGAVAKGLVPVAMSLPFADQETLVVFERPWP